MKLMVLVAACLVLGASAAERPEPILNASHGEFIMDLAFSPTGRWLLSLGSDYRAIVWDVSSFRPIRSVPVTDFGWGSGRKLWDIAFSADDDSLFVLGPRVLVKYPLRAGAVRSIPVTPFGFEPREMTVSPDGQWIVASDYLNDRIAIRNVSTDVTTMMASEDTPLEDFAWAGSLLGGKNRKEKLSAVDVRTRRGIPRPIFDGQYYRQAPFEIIRQPKDPEHLLSLRDRRTGRENGPFPIALDATRKGAIAPNGKLLAVDPGRGVVRFFALPDARPIDPEVVEVAPVRHIQFLLGGLATFDKNLSLVGWEIGDRGFLTGASELAEFDDIAISQNGTYSAFARSRDIAVFKVASGEPQPILVPRDQTAALLDPPELAVSNDGRYVAYREAKGSRNSLRINGFSPPFCDAVPEAQVRYAFSPDSKLLAFSCAGTLSVVDLLNNSLLPASAQISKGSPVAFTPKAGQLVTVTGNVISFRDPRTLKVLRTVTAKGPVRSLAFHRLDLLMAATTANDGVQVFHIEQPDAPLLSTIQIDEFAAKVLAISDSGTVATGGLDGILRFWDFSNGDLMCVLLHSSPPFQITGARLAGSTQSARDWIAVSPNGFFDGSGPAVSWISWRNPSDGRVYNGDFFFSDFYTPGLLSMVFRYQPPSAKTGWDLIAELRFPGLRLLVDQGQARIQRDANSTALCLQQPPANLDIYLQGEKVAWNTSEFVYSDSDVDCRYRKTFPKAVRLEVLNSHRLTPGLFTKTPWDGRTEQQTRDSRLHIQVIAIEKYDSGKTGLPALPAARVGAEAIQDHFKQQQTPAPFSSLTLWSPLIDKNATRDAIVGRIGEIATDAGPNDVVLLYFAGHGIIPAGQGLYYFLPVDVRNESLKSYRETAVSSAHLADLLRRMRSRKILVIIDSCQSGGALEGLAKAAESVALDEMEKTRVRNASGPPLNELGVGIYLLASTSPFQITAMDLSGASALVRALVKALHGDSMDSIHGDSFIWAGEVMENVKKSSLSWPESQRPVILKLGYDFPIASRH